MKVLTVLTGAQVIKLRHSGTRCIGARCLGGRRAALHRRIREIVLSAGTIDTPRLLMLSGIGPPVELERLGIAAIVDLPGVGRNLQDHILVAGLCFEAEAPTPPAKSQSRRQHLLLGKPFRRSACRT